MMNALSSNRAYENYKGYYGYQPKIKQNEHAKKVAINESIFINSVEPFKASNEVSFKGNALSSNFLAAAILPLLTAGFATAASAFKKNANEVSAIKSSPSTYRAKLPTPDYSHTRENFPIDAHQSTSKSGSAVDIQLTAKKMV